MPIADIETFLQDYFEVLQTQDMALFDRVFHPSCVLYSQQGGATVVRPLAEYRNIVINRASPLSGGYPRQDEILMVDMLSPEMALAKVRLRLFDNIMLDYLNLLNVDGQWRIVAKLFHREATVASGR